MYSDSMGRPEIVVNDLEGVDASFRFEAAALSSSCAFAVPEPPLAGFMTAL